MKIKFLSIFVLFYFYSFTQVNKIDLPERDGEIKINTTTPIFSIYIDKKDNVYVEKKPVKINEIGKLLQYFRYKIPLEHYRPLIKVFLYIDKKANYSVIDKVKTEIASVRIYNLVYKTGSIDDKDLLNGLSFRNHQAFFNYQLIEKKLTKIQEKLNRKYNDSLREISKNSGTPMFPPLPPPDYWTTEFIYKLYSDQQEVIDEVLNERTYSCVTISNQGIVINLEIIDFQDKVNIEKLFLNNEVLIAKFEDSLDYKSYFKMIKIIREIEKKYRGIKQFAFFAELSSEIKEIHIKSGVKVCH